MEDDHHSDDGTVGSGGTLEDDQDLPDWREMERRCRQLRRNQITSFRDLEIYNDSYAFQLAGCLMTNTSLKHAGIVVWEDVTELGAQALAKGIAHSAMDSFSITTNDKKYGLNFDSPTAKRWKVLWCICQPALQMVRTLKLDVPLSDVEVSKLGGEWMRNNTLKQVVLDISHTTIEGVSALWSVMKQSGISHICLAEISSAVFHVLTSEGILRSPALSHLNISAYDTSDRVASLCDWTIATAKAQRLSMTPRQDLPGLQSLTLIFTIERPDCLSDDDVRKLSTETSDQNENLKRLTLDGSMISDDGVVHLAESWSQKWPLLERLDLCYNKVGPFGLSRLIQVSSLHHSFKTLILCHNPTIGRYGLSSIAPVLIDALKNFQVQSLCLGSCDLTGKDVGVLCKGLHNNRSLKSLNLAGNQIGDRGVASLVECLNHGWLLEELYLSSNPLSALAVQKLVKVSSARDVCLKILDVKNCDCISYQNFVVIAKELSTSKLSKFSIQVDDVKVPDAKPCPNAKAQRATRDEARAMAGRALVTAVKANMHLRDLSLQLIDIPQGDKNKIEFFLNLETSGRQLLRLEDGLNPFGLWSHVLAKCRKSMSVVYYLLREQPALIPSATDLAGLKWGGAHTKSESPSVITRKRKLDP